MTINDDILSAFLDGELPEHEMAQVQDAIASDAGIAIRFNELARVHALVSQQAALIDQVPMPESVLALLQSGPTQTDKRQQPAASNVVELSRLRKVRLQAQQFMHEHAALAASIALVIGFAGGQWLSVDKSNAGDAALYAALDVSPSGQQVALGDGSQIMARFSFMDTESRFCRQYQVQDEVGSSENLACRDQSGWTLMASARIPGQSATQSYTTASGPRLLDSLLDVMMTGPALSQSEEQAAINSQWQAE